MKEFIYFSMFDKNWNELGLTEEDLRELENTIIDNPELGKLIQGTGGLRKIRFALPHKGKSGGVRVLYVEFAFFEKLFMLNVYPKNKKESLSAEEKAMFKKAIKALEDDLKRG